MGRVIPTHFAIMHLSDASQIEVTSRAARRAWLVAHHTLNSGARLVTHKKAAGDRYLPTVDILQE